MLRSIFPAIVVAVTISTAAWAQPLSLAPPTEDTEETRPILVAAQGPQTRPELGGGFIEFLFGNGAAQSRYRGPAPEPERAYANTAPAADPRLEPQAPGREFDPRYLPQEVDYHGKETPGTIVIDTPNKFLFLVQGDGKAMRYGIGVGRPGFTWSGVHDDFGQEGMAGLDAAAGNARSASPICRTTWKAVRTIRSARARCISARRSTASTARTSPGPSAPTCRPAASACAMRT